MLHSHKPVVNDGHRSTRLKTVAEVAAEWGVHRNTIHRLVARGDLRAVRVGRRLRFRPEDVRAYLERDV